MKKWDNLYVGFTVAWIVCILAWQIDWAHKDAPAWVQAIGSIVAILAAVGVGVGAHLSQRIRDENEHARIKARDKEHANDLVVKLLQLFLDEVEIILERNTKAISEILNPSLQGAVMNPIFMADQPFSVFRAHIDQLSSIPSRDLRKMLLKTYGTLTSVRTFITTNNAYLERFEKARDAYSLDKGNQVFYDQYEFAKKALDFWGTKLRGEWSKAGNECTSLIAALSAEIDRREGR